MTNIPLVRVTYAESFTEVLNQIGAPTERLLNQLNLSEEVLAVPGGYMIVEKLWKVCALAASYSGLPDIGLKAGMTPLEKHGQLSRTAAQAVGYREVIEHLNGQRDHESTIEKVLTRTRRFARHQETWFRGLTECRILDIEHPYHAAEIAEQLIELGS